MKNPAALRPSRPSDRSHVRAKARPRSADRPDKSQAAPPQDTLAILAWVPASKGGRAAPPPGPKFRAVARFVNDTTWPAESWSLGIERTRSRRKGFEWVARIAWLAGNAAPQHVLRPGERFELYEGRRIVASGLVVEGTQPAPSVAAARQLLT